VGLKQTILFPFVTLGSLVNFCDCLMAGGTSKKDHSEVGSSYIHFNYTPEQDKATPSLIGDVPQGVMVNRPPIFLGGQGGAVGPVRIGYGTVVKAGTILRKDVAGGKLVGGGTLRLKESAVHTLATGEEKSGTTSFTWQTSSPSGSGTRGYGGSSSKGPSSCRDEARCPDYPRRCP